ncbi:MAG: hypothetical protein GX417_13745 [Clostridiales bacterium]|nr:hypothetical protein [Clostridiales bacterium]
MPYIRFELNQKLSQQDKLAFAAKAAESVAVIPGKRADRTMVNVTTECALHFHGSDRAIAFVEIRLFGQSEREQKTALAEQLASLLGAELNIAADDIYMNMIEMPSWGKSGSLAFSETWKG